MACLLLGLSISPQEKTMIQPRGPLRWGCGDEKPGKRRDARCVVHIAEPDEQKCSKRFTAATIPIATDDASIADPASVPRRGPYVGAAWSGSGQAPAHCGRDGGIGGRQLCGKSVRWRRAAWISTRRESGAM